MSKLMTPEAQDKLRGNEHARHFKLAALALAVSGALAMTADAAEPADDLYHQVQRQVAALAPSADVTPRSILEREALFTPPNLDELVPLEGFESTEPQEHYEVREPQSIGQDVTIERMGTFRIPSPDPTIDYSSDPGRPLHGNAIYALPPLDPNKPYAQVKAEKTENPLASPYYNVATGQIDYPEEVLRQKQLDAYVSPEEERATRLKDYDKERVAQLKDANQYVPFDGLVQHDAVYSYLPEEAQVFYVDREADRARLEEEITQIEKRSHGTLGFALLDQNGIVALKDNSAYPLVGLTKFHLAYAVASLMSDRLENQNTRVFFFTDMLRSDVYSPLADILYKKATRIVRDATGRAILDPNSLENQPTTNERSAIIASTVRQYQAGEDISVDLDEVRLRSIPKQAVEDAHRNLPKGERLSLAIGDLMYYSLGFSDSNASAILLQYLGNSLKSLELFDRIKGLYRAKFTAFEYDIDKDPRLASANTAPLYESAKLMALYAEDTKINPEVRKFVNEIMYFNVTGKDAIQRGVRESIYFQEQERLGKDVPRFSSHKQINSVPTPPSLKIYSREGIGGIVEDEGRRTSISDLALIEYEGRSYVLVVAVKDIRGRLAQSKRNGEQAIAATARTLFDYILSRPLAAPSAATTPAAQ